MGLATEPDGTSRDTELDDAELAAAGFAQPGQTPRGLIGSLSTVDHKVVGRRYLVTAFVFLCLGGLKRRR